MRRITVTQTEFENTLKRIAELKRELAPFEKTIKYITDEMEMLKVDAMAYMQQIRSKRTEPVNGYYLTRVAGRTSKRVIDEGLATDWLASLEDDKDVTEYYELNEKAVINRYEKYLKETGELLDFIEVTQGPEYVTVKQEEKK